MVAAVPDGHLSIVCPIDDPTIPWPGLILGVPFLGFWYWTTNQYIVQRVLGAKNVVHARWGVMLAGFLKIIPLFIMVIPGVIAVSVFPNLENPDSVFPTAVLNVLPVGLVGLVLAGLISAIMSSIDSTLNSASTLVVMDFIKTQDREISEQAITNYGRMTTLILMIVAAVWAPMIANFGGIWVYLQQMFAIIVPPIVVIFLVGVFYKKGNGDGAFWTLILGTLVGIILFVLGQMELWTLHYTINVGFIVGICTILFVVISRLSTQEVSELAEQSMYRPGLLMPTVDNLKWYQDYRIHALVLFLCIMAILVLFW